MRPKIHKSIITESAIETQNNEIIEIFEPNDLKVEPNDRKAVLSAQ